MLRLAHYVITCAASEILGDYRGSFFEWSEKSSRFSFSAGPDDICTHVERARQSGWSPVLVCANFSDIPIQDELLDTPVMMVGTDVFSAHAELAAPDSVLIDGLLSYPKDDMSIPLILPEALWKAAIMESLAAWFLDEGILQNELPVLDTNEKSECTEESILRAWREVVTLVFGDLESRRLSLPLIVHDAPSSSPRLAASTSIDSPMPDEILDLSDTSLGIFAVARFYNGRRRLEFEFESGQEHDGVVARILLELASDAEVVRHVDIQLSAMESNADVVTGHGSILLTDEQAGMLTGVCWGIQGAD